VSDPTGWFEPLYRAAAAGDAVVPWDDHAPSPLLVEWSAARSLSGHGRRAVVVGCGLGDDAEHVASLGFDTVAFDIAPTAIAGARRRFRESRVEYVVADLLAPPDAWRAAFDLVVEHITVQALPSSVRPTAIAAVSGLVAPGGTLLVVSGARDDDEAVDGPPWPLTRAEVESFATGGVELVRVEELAAGPERPWARSWRAELRRPHQAARRSSAVVSARTTVRGASSIWRSVKRRVL
jgi:SAM-dependent methyltransferase